MKKCFKSDSYDGKKIVPLVAQRKQELDYERILEEFQWVTEQE